MKKVLLTEKMNPEFVKLFEGKAHVHVASDISEEALVKESLDVFGIVLKSASKITRKIIENAPQLKVISRTGTGYDNVDVEAATEHGVLVCNLPGINSTTVAEHAIALILCLFKSLFQLDRYVREGKWIMRNKRISADIAGKILGIIGFGKIGQEVAKKATYGLDMKVMVYDPYILDANTIPGYRPIFSNVVFCNDINELFSKADVISIHVPNTPETKEMVNKELLWKMKSDAYIINTSRGGIIEEKALIDALGEKRIAGAGLDVFENEPIANDHPFIKMDNIILSPHAAALTRECGARAAIEAIRQVIDCLEGRIPPYIVNGKELGIK